MIEIKDLTFRFGQENSKVIDGLNCTFESAGVIALAGRSGVGKSTLISLLSGIYSKSDHAIGGYSGTVFIDGRSPESLRTPVMVSWVPQASILLDHLSALDNVLVPTSDREKFVPRATQLLRDLGLGDSTKKRPRELSGGMRTRVAFARALLCRPQYLFLDEPFASLDLGSRWRLYELVARERWDNGTTTLLTTHNIPEAMLLSDRIVTISRENETTVAHVHKNLRQCFDIARGAALAAARQRAGNIEAEIYEI